MTKVVNDSEVMVVVTAVGVVAWMATVVFVMVLEVFVVVMVMVMVVVVVVVVVMMMVVMAMVMGMVFVVLVLMTMVAMVVTTVVEAAQHVCLKTEGRVWRPHYDRSNRKLKKNFFLKDVGEV